MFEVTVVSIEVPLVSLNSKGRCDKPCNERQPDEQLVILVRRQQPRNETADTGDTSGRGHHQHRREPDQGSADACGNGGEFCHRLSLSLEAQVLTPAML